VRGNFDDCLKLSRGLADNYPVSLVNSVNPVRLEGQKTAAFEVVDRLGDAPDYHLMPIGNAGNMSAYWLGYQQYAEAGKAQKLPVLRAFQAEGAAPLVLGKPVEFPETRATAIRIGNPASWKQAEAARDESEGLIDSVTDGEILAAQRLLASSEGIFAEPASAASLAVLVKSVRSGAVAPGSSVVCVLTGSGLKDPDAARKELAPPVAVDEDVDNIARLLKL
jgi:threonine synthase